MSIELSFEQKRFFYRELNRMGEVLEVVGSVAFDCDQILIASQIPATRVLNQQFKERYKSSEMRWFLIRDVAIAHGFSPVDAQLLDEYIWSDPDVLSDSPPIPGALETLRLISREKETHIATSRLPFLERVTRDYFGLYAPEHPQERIHINRDNRIPGAIFKAVKYLELKVGLVFEDSYSQAKEILKRTQEIQTYVVLVASTDDSYNLEDERIIRLPSMMHVFAHLTGNPV